MALSLEDTSVDDAPALDYEDESLPTSNYEFRTNGTAATLTTE